MGLILKSAVATTLLLVVSFNFAKANCEVDHKASCDSAFSAIEYYNELIGELQNRQTDCKENCDFINKEMNNVNACLQEVIAHHNTACSIGFNDDEMGDDSGNLLADDSKSSAKNLAMK